MDILYDPQTSGGLLISLPEADAADCLAKLKAELEYAEIIGCVGQQAEYSIYIE